MGTNGAALVIAIIFTLSIGGFIVIVAGVFAIAKYFNIIKNVYRIVKHVKSKGDLFTTFYTIQYRVLFFLWLTCKYDKHYTYDIESIPYEFNSQQDAENAIDSWHKEEKAKEFNSRSVVKIIVR